MENGNVYFVSVSQTNLTVHVELHSRTEIVPDALSEQDTE